MECKSASTERHTRCRLSASECRLLAAKAGSPYVRLSFLRMAEFRERDVQLNLIGYISA